MCLMCNIQAEAKGFLKNVGKFIGNVAEAAVVVAVDHTVDKYAPEQATQYRESMRQLNERSQRKAEEDQKAWDEYSQYRKNKLQKELSHASNSETREMIRQEMAELDGVSTRSASNYNTSLASSILSEVGIAQQNIHRGLAWNDAQNKHDKQNVTKDFVFDVAGEISNNSELFEKFRQIANVQNSYLSKKSMAMTTEEKQAALSDRNREYFNIGYDTYQEAKERNSQYLANKLQVSQKLMESGWYQDTQLAEEVAGSIIAIQKSNLSEQEKESLLNAYGFGNAKQISQAFEDVIAYNENITNTEIERIKESTEFQRQQAELSATEERKKAIHTIEVTKLDCYAFDKTDLTQSQESLLDNIVLTLKQYSDVQVYIIGHTCNIGYKSVNLKKGMKRADATKEYLVNKGISQDRISVNSKGELEPLEKNDSENNRKLNRRVEIIVE